MPLECSFLTMEIIDNINKTLKDDMIATLCSGSLSGNEVKGLDDFELVYFLIIR